MDKITFPKEIITYKFFQNPEEFENWQIDDDRKIFQIMPSPNGIDFKETDSPICSANVDVGVIVIYAKVVEV